MEWKRVARDTVLILLLTGVGGFLVGFAAARNGHELPIAILGVSNVGLSVVGFAISGSLKRSDRVRHLLTVAVLVWGLSLVNLGFGVTLGQWLASGLAILFACAVGGGISRLIRPEVEAHAAELPSVLPGLAVDLPVTDEPEIGAPIQMELATFPTPAPVSARRSLRVFLLYLGAQLVVSFGVGILLGTAFALQGGDTNDAVSMDELAKQVEGPAGVAGLVAGGLAIAWSELRRRRRLDPGFRRAVGWKRSDLRSLLAATACGVSTALVYLVLAGLLGSPTSEYTPGPMTRMALSSGWQHQLWQVGAVAISPPIEEFLFRGVLLAGLAASWGNKVAAVVTTLLFVSMHYFEIVGYPAAILGLTGLSCMTLYFRFRSDSLLPPIAVHFGYNLLLVVANMIATRWIQPT
jgi:membrane protease YdiL (CAAX protease family)